MKLVELPDEVLLQLYQKYNYNNIIRKNWDGARYPYYFIPIELIINFKLLKKYCYDISSEGGWLCSNKVSIALPKLCGITPQIYYDLLVLHINDTESRPRCKYCNSLLSWQGRIIRGYNSQYQGQENNYCSRNCEMKYIWSHPETAGKLGEHLISGSGFYKSAAKNKLIKFMNLGNPNDIVDFYIAITFDGQLKYGVSNNALSQGWHKDYRKRKVILKSERYKIASLEYDISTELNSSSEYIDFNIKSILRFVEAYCKACKRHRV